MALSEFAGIFSRAFVVGYFLPSFFGLFVLRVVADARAVPDAFQRESGATEVLVIGGLAILTGLLLSGLSRAITRLLQGYPFKNAKRGPLKAINDRLIRRWENRFDDLEAARQATADTPERTSAAIERYKSYPARRESLLPTEFGNVLRSFETHPRDRYGLDGVAFWPRVDLLLEDGEREVISDAQTNVSFFVNGLVVLATVTLVLLADRAWHAHTGLQAAWQALIVVLVGAAGCWTAYRLAISALREWGGVVRAAFDLHRREVYEKMGLKLPETADEERRLATAVNRCLIFAEPFPDAFRVARETSKD